MIRRERGLARVLGALFFIGAAYTIASCSGVGISASSGGLGGGVATSPGNYFVTGSITYLQAVALPEDAVIQVNVADVSKEDTPSEILGGVEFTADGKQVPIEFEVRVPKQSVERRATVVVQARIEDAAGDLLFITDTHTPVITNGAPKNVELVLAPANRAAE